MCACVCVCIEDVLLQRSVYVIHSRCKVLVEPLSPLLSGQVVFECLKEGGEKV